MGECLVWGLLHEQELWGKCTNEAGVGFKSGLRIPVQGQDLLAVNIGKEMPGSPFA